MAIVVEIDNPPVPSGTTPPVELEGPNVEILLPATEVILDGVTLGNVDQEYVRNIPIRSKSFSFRVRGNTADIRYAFETGKVAGRTYPYMTLHAGEVYSKENVYMGTATNIYFATSVADTFVEIEFWR